MLDTPATRDGWERLWRELGAPASDELLYRKLLAAYAESQRHYHTQQHLAECLARLAELRAVAERAAEVELALWFHDAIYDVHRSDNEARSADWAERSILAAGLAREVGQRVHALIMFTRHAVEPIGRDAEVLVDVDLSILAAPAERFDEYERQVRAEYAWVPDFLFRRNRRKVLGEFLARPRIYSTPLYLERDEPRARFNLERSLQNLK